MAHLYRNETINTLAVSALSHNESAGPGGVRRLHKFNLWYLRQNFSKYWIPKNVSVIQIIPCLAILSKKSEIDIVNIVKNSTANSLASIHF